LLLFLLFLAVYTRTAAPSVLSGDSAEFQLAAPLLGVPHPTTYPLYVLLGKLATLLIPLGDIAWRVTLVSALCAALAVALFFLLARRIVGLAGAVVAALALGVTPGLWNAATLAEVYALLAALLAGLGWLLATNDDRLDTDRILYRVPTDTQSKIQNLAFKIVSLTHSRTWRLRAAAFVAGLGCTHHGLFVLTGLPLFVGYTLWALGRPRTGVIYRAPTKYGRDILRPYFAILALCFVAGLTPWLFPLVQFARYGPFDGADYGLPRHYFWGAPQSWPALIDLLSGGTVRRGIFRVPAAADALATLRMVGARLWFEFGPLGVVLGLVGSAALFRRSRVAWAGAAWVFLITLAYLLLLGPAVADAPIFTLPMLLPWALWVGAAAEFFLWKTNDQRRKTKAGISLRPFVLRPSSFVLMLLLVAATLAWGYTRIQYSSKRRLWLFREFGQVTLAGLPPNAAVIAHWEQGMTLQYLRLVEGQRPDVWIDVLEPSDEAWGARAARRYANRPVFFVGSAADVAGLPTELVRASDYAGLFRLRR
jgi:hypothetical protein